MAELLASKTAIIEETLESFGVPAQVVEVNQGPVVTQFGIEPGFVTGRGGKQTKVKVSKISKIFERRQFWSLERRMLI